MAKMNENVKNMRNHVGKIFGKKQAQKIGTYMESTGGGTPLAKGEKLKDHPEAKRVKQPRDEDGRFTYNSANAKPLKYGPSRGETVPPFLRGAKIVFATKKNKSVVYDNTTWNFQVQMEAADLVKMFQDILGAKSAADLMERKKGRKSDKENQALKKNQQGFVNSDTEITEYKISEFKQKCDAALEKGKKVTPKFAEKSKKVVSNKSDANLAQPVKNNNSDLAKNNPDKYIEENFDALNDIVSLAESKGYDVDVDAIVGGIANGDISSLEDFKKELENS